MERPLRARQPLRPAFPARHGRAAAPAGRTAAGAGPGGAGGRAAWRRSQAVGAAAAVPAGTPLEPGPAGAGRALLPADAQSDARHAAQALRAPPGLPDIQWPHAAKRGKRGSGRRSRSSLGAALGTGMALPPAAARALARWPRAEPGRHRLYLGTLADTAPVLPFGRCPPPVAALRRRAAVRTRPLAAPAVGRPGGADPAGRSRRAPRLRFPSCRHRPLPGGDQ